MSKRKQEADNMASVMDQVAKRVEKKAKAESVVLEIPQDGDPVATFRLHLDIGLSGAPATALRRLAVALDKRNERLAGGKRCVNTNDAVRWLLEQIAEG